MANDHNATELSESTTPLGLCYLMIDLERTVSVVLG
jgi:hypothetical protein